MSDCDRDEFGVCEPVMDFVGDDNIDFVADRGMDFGFGVGCALGVERGVFDPRGVAIGRCVNRTTMPSRAEPNHTSPKRKPATMK
jgi:hypothetical protein